MLYSVSKTTVQKVMENEQNLTKTFYNNKVNIVLNHKKSANKSFGAQKFRYIIYFFHLVHILKSERLFLPILPKINRIP